MKIFIGMNANVARYDTPHFLGLVYEPVEQTESKILDSDYKTVSSAADVMPEYIAAPDDKPYQIVAEFHGTRIIIATTDQVLNQISYLEGYRYDQPKNSYHIRDLHQIFAAAVIELSKGKEIIALAELQVHTFRF